MIDFTVETDIDRPVGEVFAHATDPATLSTWQVNTVSAVQEGDGPMGVGTRIREVHRGPGGKEMKSLVEVAEYEPDRAFALRVVEGSLPIHGRMTFEPASSGTHVSFRVYGQPTGPLRLAQPLLRRALRRQFAEHCENLEKVLEADRRP